MSNTSGGRASPFSPSLRAVLLLQVLALLAFLGSSLPVSAQYLPKISADSYMSSQCQYNLFPVTAGGSKDEKVSCTIYDKANE